MTNNLQKGKLKRWNDDKGYGFIGSEHGRRDIFIHISALNRMSRRPVVGDVITYQVHTDNDGKQRAVNGKIEGVAELNLNPSRKHIKQKKENNWISKTLSVALVVGIALFVYVKYMKNSEPQGKASTLISSYSIDEQNSENYSCAGKVYCSEMTSCDEAKFYQRNCPGTKMDGDGDGIPCESQWCRR
jgi:cold shock CspA family protein